MIIELSVPGINSDQCAALLSQIVGCIQGQGLSVDMSSYSPSEASRAELANAATGRAVVKVYQ